MVCADKEQKMPSGDGRHLGTMARGALAVFVGLLVARVLRYSLNLIVARMGSEVWGGISLGLAYFEILSTLVCLGMLTGVVRNVALYLAEGDAARVRGTILSAWGLATVTGLVVATGLWLSSQWLAVEVFDDPGLSIVFRAIAWLIPINAGYQVLAKVLLGGQQVSSYVAIWRIGDNALKFLVVLSLYLLGWELEAVLLAYAVAAGAGLFASAMMVHRRVCPLFGGRSTPAVFQIRKLLALSLPLMLTGFLGIFAGWVDTLCLGFFHSTATVGLYAAAMLVSSLITLGPDLVYPVILPLLSERQGQEDTESLRAAFATATRWILWTSVPSAALVLVFSGPLLTEFFGPEYSEGRISVEILIVGRLLYVLSWTRSTVLVITERTGPILWMTIVANVANGILNVWLIPIFGLAGAAVATAASLALHAVLTFIVVSRIPETARIAGSWFPGSSQVLLATAAASLVAWGALTVIGFHWAGVTLCAVIFSVVYAATLVLMRAFVAEDLYVIRTALDKAGLTAPAWLYADADRERG